MSLAVAKDLLVGAYDESEPRVLLEMARAYKVDVAKLDRERKAAAATKSARKRVQTSAKSKRAKKKRK